MSEFLGRLFPDLRDRRALLVGKRLRSVEAPVQGDIPPAGGAATFYPRP